MLLEEAQGIAPELAIRVRTAAAAQRTEEARLAKLARDSDDTVGRNSRRFMVGLLGVSWAATLPFGERFGPTTHLRYALGALGQLVVVGVACLLAPGVIGTLYNRRIVATITLAIAAQSVMFVSMGALGASVASARTLMIGLWAFAAGVLTISLDRRLWLMTAVASVAFGVAVLFPELRSWAAAVAAVGVTVNIALASSSK